MTHDSARASLLAHEVLAVNVILYRARRGLSQTALAQQSGVSRQTISGIERRDDNPTVDVIARIADALDVEVADLFLRDRDDVADAAELERRLDDRSGGSVDARALLAAVDEAAGHSPKRYSRAGRPPLAR